MIQTQTQTSGGAIVLDSKPRKDPNCVSYTGGVCDACSNRYYFDSNRVCVPVNPSCKDFNPLNGACITCYAGYAISGSTCIVSRRQDPNCRTYT